MVSNCKKHDCNHFSELIDKRLDSDITPEENRDLNSHLADCNSCRDELVSYEMINSMLEESSEEMVEVPEGFFENLASKLEEEEIKPARSFWSIFQSPFFRIRTGYALAMASFLLVGITTMAVGFGIAGSGNGAEPALAGSSDGLAYIETNNGEAFVVDDQQSDAELYEAALDELRQAFSESAGENSGDSGYIHTTWDGGATDSQIR